MESLSQITLISNHTALIQLLTLHRLNVQVLYLRFYDHGCLCLMKRFLVWLCKVEIALMDQGSIIIFLS